MLGNGKQGCRLIECCNKRRPQVKIRHFCSTVPPFLGTGGKKDDLSKNGRVFFQNALQSPEDQVAKAGSGNGGDCEFTSCISLSHSLHSHGELTSRRKGQCLGWPAFSMPKYSVHKVKPAFNPHKMEVSTLVTVNVT